MKKLRKLFTLLFALVFCILFTWGCGKKAAECPFTTITWEHTLEDIQGQCAILFTQKNLNANFGRKPKDTAAPVVADVFQQTPAAEVNSRYGVLPTKKD